MRFVVEGVGLTAGGGKELAVTLLSHMLVHREHEFLLVVPDLPEYAHFEGTNVRRLPYPAGRSLASRYWFLSRALPSICAQAKADALLCLGNFAPRKPPCPTVAFVQNAWLAFPAPDSNRKPTLREWLIIQFGLNSLRHLSPLVHIVVQTPRMRERMIAVFNLSPERVTVVPGALLKDPDGSTTPTADLPRDTAFTFLCLAHYYTHKNLEVLVEAMKRLPGHAPEDAKCLITISPHQHPGARKLLKRIEDENLNDRILNIGPITAYDRFRVYRSADAFVLPTLLETFSFTYLEAMHFGLPILTSDRDFAHDRCQDAAIYFDPLDADSVAMAMARVVEDQELRRTLVESGRRVLAKVPTWDEIAGQFVDVLERAAHGERLGALDTEARVQEAMAT